MDQQTFNLSSPAARIQSSALVMLAGAGRRVGGAVSMGAGEIVSAAMAVNEGGCFRHDSTP
jgi:hypothetical protein